MREIMEFRIPERDASEYLDASVGKRIGDTGSTRKVIVPTDDPLYERILDINREFRASGRKAFFLGWSPHREYTKEETANAEAFKLIFDKQFEPSGEECGTVYEDILKCPHCGIGRTQASTLRLDLRKIPKTKDIASTIADEIIVSQRFAETVLSAGLTGFELRGVRHKARYEDDPIDLKSLSIGQQILDKAENAGVPHPTWSFWVWLNRPENKALMDQAETEYAEKRRAVARRRGTRAPVWYQFVVISEAVNIVSPSQVGVNPSNDDPDGQFRCPLGHNLGLNLISELSISREDFSRRHADIVQTRQCVGWLNRPSRLLVVSPRFREVVEKERIKGISFEVAYLR